ncbi:MAG TPA: hypothetical protein PLB96_12505 [Syntrophales bacterium]|nr:hypothetical protein [Syntrophales bacterium]
MVLGADNLPPAISVPENGSSTAGRSIKKGGKRMSLVPESEVRDVYGIAEGQKVLIKAFLQGAVYSWVKNRMGEQFAARDLVGGENFEWAGTPLYALYEKHIDAGKANEEAIEAAGKDVGWLLKAVISEDKRHFEVGRSGPTAGYRWIGNEP